MLWVTPTDIATGDFPPDSSSILAGATIQQIVLDHSPPYLSWVLSRLDMLQDGLGISQQGTFAGEGAVVVILRGHGWVIGEK